MNKPAEINNKRCQEKYELNLKCLNGKKDKYSNWKFDKLFAKINLKIF
jgi:hypothetical protein